MASYPSPDFHTGYAKYRSFGIGGISVAVTQEKGKKTWAFNAYCLFFIIVCCRMRGILGHADVR